MKSIEVTFKHGHLITKDTKQAVYISEDADLVLVIDEKNLTKGDKLFQLDEILHGVAKLEKVKNHHKKSKIAKLISSGTNLIFRIGLGKRRTRSDDKEFLFKCILHEDLYMYQTKNGEWQLCNCVCETIQCIDGSLVFSQTIPATSLNQLFANTVAYYFPLMRSGACNVFEEFHDSINISNPNLGSYKLNKNLNFYRDKIVFGIPPE